MHLVSSSTLEAEFINRNESVRVLRALQRAALHSDVWANIVEVVKRRTVVRRRREVVAGHKILEQQRKSLDLRLRGFGAGTIGAS